MRVSAIARALDQSQLLEKDLAWLGGWGPL